MALTGFLQDSVKLEIQEYKRPQNTRILKETHVPFTGSPYRHPYDPERVILIADPFSTQTLYYEFRKQDISYLEELPKIVTLENETVSMVRIWVKKKSVALRYTPFVVDETAGNWIIP